MFRLGAVLVLLAASGADAIFEKARSAQVAGRLDEAEKLYRQYLERYPPKAEIVANLGALLARREDFAGAIQQYRQALKLDPSLHPLHLNLGLAFLKSGQAGEAAAELDRFLAREPNHRQAMQLRALALLEAGRHDAAEEQFRALLPAGDVGVTLGLATALLRQGKSAEARAVLTPVLNEANSAEAQLALGQLLAQEGRLDEALAAFEAARRLNPALPHLRLSIGSVLWRQRRTAEAVAEWRAEYETNPISFEVLYTLGSALSMNPASKTEAETLLRKAVALRTGNAPANYQLAKLVWQQTKNPEALVFLQRATRADPDFREAFYLQGTVQKALGQTAAAAKSFARVKELSSKELARQQDIFSESR